MGNNGSMPACDGDTVCTNPRPTQSSGSNLIRRSDHLYHPDLTPDAAVTVDPQFFQQDSSNIGIYGYDCNGGVGNSGYYRCYNTNSNSCLPDKERIFVQCDAGNMCATGGADFPKICRIGNACEDPDRWNADERRLREKFLKSPGDNPGGRRLSFPPMFQDFGNFRSMVDKDNLKVEVWRERDGEFMTEHTNEDDAELQVNSLEDCVLNFMARGSNCGITILYNRTKPVNGGKSIVIDNGPAQPDSVRKPNSSDKGSGQVVSSGGIFPQAKTPQESKHRPSRELRKFGYFHLEIPDGNPRSIEFKVDKLNAEKPMRFEFDLEFGIQVNGVDVLSLLELQRSFLPDNSIYNLADYSKTTTTSSCKVDSVESACTALKLGRPSAVPGMYVLKNCVSLAARGMTGQEDLSIFINGGEFALETEIPLASTGFRTLKYAITPITTEIRSIDMMVRFRRPKGAKKIPTGDTGVQPCIVINRKEGVVCTGGLNILGCVQYYSLEGEKTTASPEDDCGVIQNGIFRQEGCYRMLTYAKRNKRLQCSPLDAQRDDPIAQGNTPYSREATIRNTYVPQSRESSKPFQTEDGSDIDWANNIAVARVAAPKPFQYPAAVPQD